MSDSLAQETNSGPSRSVLAHQSRIGDVLLKVENITLRFGGVKAINGVSFDIRKGEVRSIIGPNGAGKSSMLNCINGFYQPQEGSIWYQGKTYSPMRPYDAASNGIARTFQKEPNLERVDAQNICECLNHTDPPRISRAPRPDRRR